MCNSISPKFGPIPSACAEQMLLGHNAISRCHEDAFLFAQTKEKEKTAWKVVCDPVAEERQWLAACTVVGDKTVPGRASVWENMGDVPHAWLMGVAGLICMIGIFFCGFTAINTLSDALAIPDTLTTWSDWYSALMLMVCLPAAACAFTGYLQRARAREIPHVWMLPAVAPFIAGFLGYMNAGLPAVLPIAVFGLFASWGSYQIGRELAKWWQQFCAPKKLLAPIVALVGMLSLMMITMLVTGNVPHDNSPHVQSDPSSGLGGVWIVVATAFVSGFVTAAFCRSKQLCTRIGATVTMQVPMMLFFATSFVGGAAQALVSALGGHLDAAVLVVATLAPLITLAPSLAGAITAHAIQNSRAFTTHVKCIVSGEITTQ